MGRVAIRIALGLGLVAVAWIATEMMLGYSRPDDDSRALLAALLAVIAAIVSAWTSQRIVEFQEDQLKPNPVPEFDLRSRYQLAQIKITNYGGSPAYDVEVKWDRPLLRNDGTEVMLGAKGTIPVLDPGSNASVALGVGHDFFSKNEDTTFQGTIIFRDAAGRLHAKRFVVSAEHERRALTHNDEAAKAYYELQKIPGVLNKINGELRNIYQYLKARDLGE